MAFRSSEATISTVRRGADYAVDPDVDVEGNYIRYWDGRCLGCMNAKDVDGRSLQPRPPCPHPECGSWTLQTMVVSLDQMPYQLSKGYTLGPPKTGLRYIVRDNYGDVVLEKGKPLIRDHDGSVAIDPKDVVSENGQAMGAPPLAVPVEGSSALPGKRRRRRRRRSHGNGD